MLFFNVLGNLLASHPGKITVTDSDTMVVCKLKEYLEDKQGCYQRCTVCIIPYGRGNNRSVPAGEIVEIIKKIVKNGYKEVVLTGVDITDYGKDLPAKPTFSNLIKRIIKLGQELEQ